MTLRSENELTAEGPDGTHLVSIESGRVDPDVPRSAAPDTRKIVASNASSNASNASNALACAWDGEAGLDARACAARDALRALERDAEAFDAFRRGGGVGLPMQARPERTYLSGFERLRLEVAARSGRLLRECVVCWDELTPPEFVALDPCGHVTCRGCDDRQRRLGADRRCPVCRSAVAFRRRTPQEEEEEKEARDPTPTPNLLRVLRDLGSPGGAMAMGPRLF